MAQFSTHSSVSVRCKRAPWLSSDPTKQGKLWWWWWKFTLDWWHVEQLSKDTNDGQLTSTLKNFGWGFQSFIFKVVKNWKRNSNKSMVCWRRFANSHNKKWPFATRYVPTPLSTVDKNSSKMSHYVILQCSPCTPFYPNF